MVTLFTQPRKRFLGDPHVETFKDKIGFLGEKLVDLRSLNVQSAWQTAFRGSVPESSAGA